MLPQKLKPPFHFLRPGGIHCIAKVVLFLLLFPLAELRAGAASAATDWVFEATNHLGQWIWDTNVFDKQTVRFWREFEIPAGEHVSRAALRITVDNGFTLFLDGREIGRGSDWRTVSEYDVTWLLDPGKHVLAVEAFNDRLEAGLILGLQIRFTDGTGFDVVSDGAWRVVPGTQRRWTERRSAPPEWRRAIIVGSIHQHPWELWPFGISVAPPLHPVILHFWQRVWFQTTTLVVCVLAVLVSLWLTTRLAEQSKAQRFLQLERARIARDIHDDLGAQLTQLVLLGEVAQSEQPAGAAARGQFNQICERARDLAHAMDEVVWAVNSQRDTLRDFVNYACKYARVYLDSTPIRCRLDVEPEIPAAAFDLPVRRNLLLAVKEAINNAAKHSQAGELFLRIYRENQKLVVMVEDSGQGFDPALAGPERNGLGNMNQRMSEIGGTCEVLSQPGCGCRVVFRVPLEHARRRPWRNWFRRGTSAAAAAQNHPGVAATPVKTQHG